MGKTFRRSQSESEDLRLLKLQAQRLEATAHRHGLTSTETHHETKSFRSMRRKLEWETITT